MLEKPNVILITVDALRADHLGFMGYKKNITPNIDALAKGSTVFTQAYSVGPNTPHSFPAILTSTYPLDYQGLQKIERPRVLISEVFKKAGFLTAAFHSNPYLTNFFGYNQGWDFYEYIFSPFGKGLIPKNKNIKKIKFLLKRVLKRFLKRIIITFSPKLFFKIRYKKYRSKDFGREFKVSAEELNKPLKEFILSAKNREKPFFSWIHYMDVHSPYFPQGKQSKEKPLSFSEFISAWIPGYLKYSKNKRFKKFITPYLNQAVKFYDQGIAYLDNELADLFEFLKKEGLYQNTVICLTADHGEEFLEHGEGFHNTKLYNELLHVPLLIKNVGQEKNQEKTKKASLLDLAPTLCRLSGISASSSFKGGYLFNRSDQLIFHQTACGPKSKNNGWVEIDNYKDSKLACQDKKWKYILNYANSEEELYNLLKDPQEQNNLIGIDYGVAKEMRIKIKKFEKENPLLSLTGKTT